MSNYIGLSPLDMHIYVFECIYAHPKPVKNGINDCTHPSIGSTGLLPLLPKFPTPRHRPSNISRQWEGMEGCIDGNMGNDGKRMEIVSLLSLLILLPHVFAACIHQKFQVPKTEVLSLIRLFWGWASPYISLTYSLYR